MVESLAATHTVEETKGPAPPHHAASAGGSAAQLPENTQITLTSKYISGLKSDVTNNIFFLDDNQIVYPAGHNIVVCDYDDNKS